MALFRVLGAILDGIIGFLVPLALILLAGKVAIKLHESSLHGIKNKKIRRAVAWAIGILLFGVLGMKTQESRSFGWVFESLE
jgi:hypothetical protein